MADTQDKHSHSRAQGTRRHAHALTGTHAPTKPAVNTKKPKHRSSTRSRVSAKTRKRPKLAPKRSDAAKLEAKLRKERIPPLLRYKESKRGKTTIRRYPGRTFYLFEEARGKPLERIEFFTSSDYHCIDVLFQDKTLFHFIIDPGFTLEADYSDWKTGDWRPIKHWRPIPSENF